MNTKKIENIFLLIIFIYAFYCSLIAGIHWDATTHIKKGEYIYKYIFSLGNYEYNLPSFHKFFPGFVFFLKTFISKFFPKYLEYEIENILNLLISFSSLFAFYRINKLLFNKETAIISFLFYFFFPSFFGHSLMNPKDTVITCSFLWIIYYTLKYLNIEDLKKKKIIIYKISFFIALGSSVRIIFLGTLIPFFFLLFLDYFFKKKYINNLFNIKKFFFDVLKIFLISYFLIILFWPEVHKNIFIDPFKIIFETLKNPPINYIPGIINGEYYFSNNTPSFYQIIVNFFYRTPEYIFLLYFFSLYFLIKFNKNFNIYIFNVNYIVIGIILFLSLSVALIIILDMPLYDNMRIYSYLIPIYLIIPSLTMGFLIKNYKYRINKFFLILSLILFLIHFFKFIMLTPYQYVYLNYFNGPFKNNIDKFEMDYLGISIKELVKDADFLNKNNTKITVCGNEPTNLKIYLKKNKYFNARIVRENENPDYAILTNRIYWKDYKNLEEIKNCYTQKSYLGQKIKTVNRLGLDISVIRKLK